MIFLQNAIQRAIKAIRSGRTTFPSDLADQVDGLLNDHQPDGERRCAFHGCDDAWPCSVIKNMYLFACTVDPSVISPYYGIYKATDVIRRGLLPDFLPSLADTLDEMAAEHVQLERGERRCARCGDAWPCDVINQTYQFARTVVPTLPRLDEVTGRQMRGG